MISIMILIAFAIGYWLGKEKIHKNNAIESVLSSSKGVLGTKPPKYKILEKKLPRTLDEQTMDELDKKYAKNKD